MDTMTQFSSSYWFFRRLIPCMLLVLLGAVIAGLVRGYVLFVPGIMGMVVGGVVGWVSGRLGRGDPEHMWSFANRGWLSIGAGLFYAVCAALVVSVVNIGSMSLPLDWLAEVMAGYEGEVFVGFSTNSYQSTGGDISGGWWIFFAIVDWLLFAFLFLVATMVGWGGNETSQDSLEQKPSPIRPERLRMPLPMVSFVFFALMSLAAVIGLAMWPYSGVAPFGAASDSNLVSELHGDWIFGPEAEFLGSSETERRFTLMPGLGSELAGFSEIPTQFMLSLELRRGGVFEGRLSLGVGGILPIRMQASEDRTELIFVVVSPPIGIVSEERLTACRVSDQPSS
ncbi:MAG: hypothetical protein GY906_09740 [bacterium]|nr:hypothetical protein [bacterium]